MYKSSVKSMWARGIVNPKYGENIIKNPNTSIQDSTPYLKTPILQLS